MNTTVQIEVVSNGFLVITGPESAPVTQIAADGQAVLALVATALGIAPTAAPAAPAAPATADAATPPTPPTPPVPPAGV